MCVATMYRTHVHEAWAGRPVPDRVGARGASCSLSAGTEGVFSINVKLFRRRNSGIPMYSYVTLERNISTTLTVRGLRATDGPVRRRWKNGRSNRTARMRTTKWVTVHVWHVGWQLTRLTLAPGQSSCQSFDGSRRWQRRWRGRARLMARVWADGEIPDSQ